MARFYIFLYSILIFLPYFEGQMIISYGMRKLAMSMNQFGLDLLRHQKSNITHTSTSPINIAFCPFCIGSSLAMVLAGLWPDHRPDPSAYDSLRQALYLNSMQPQEIHLAVYDLMRHLQVNMPEGVRMKRSTSKEDEMSFHSDTFNDDGAIIEPLHAGLEERRTSLEPEKVPTPRSNTILIVSNVYIQRYLPLDYGYYVLMQQYYRTPIRSLDFSFASEESRQHINAMVEHATGGKLSNLLPSDDDGQKNDMTGHRHFWPDTKLLFMSALYFDGKLDLKEQPGRRAKITFPFLRQRGPRPKPGPLRPQSPMQPPPSREPHQNSQLLKSPMAFNATIVALDSSPITSSSTTTRTLTNKPTIISTTISPNPSKTFNPFKPLSFHKVISKESIRLRYAFNTYLNATAVEMPFVGGILSLVVLVPGDGYSMDLMLSRINAQLLADIVQNLEIRRLDITLPSLNVGHSISDMEQLLSRMGLANVFDDRTGEDVATTFAGVPNFPLAQVTRIHHKTLLNIDMEDNSYNSGEQQRRRRRRRRRRRHATERNEIVASPVIRVFEEVDDRVDNRQQGRKQSPNIKHIMGEESNLKPNYVRPIMVNAIGTTPVQPVNNKRTYVNLDDHNFIYFVLDNISGLVLAMGKYEQPNN